jgi:zinc/manganese transport system permease protein
VRALGLALLLLTGIVTAEGTQAIGALLVLGLIAAPAGAAALLTSRPYLGMALAAGIALAVMWAGLLLSYAVPSLPPSTAVVMLAVASYAGALITNRRARRRKQPRGTRAVRPGEEASAAASAAAARIIR